MKVTAPFPSDAFQQGVRLEFFLFSLTKCFFAQRILKKNRNE